MCFDTCLCRLYEQTERCCCFRTTSFQHDKIELYRHVEKKEKQNKKKKVKQEKKSAHVCFICNQNKSADQYN